MTRHATVAAERAAKLARHQQSLPEDQRLVHRALDTETIQYNISPVYENMQDHEKTAFLEMVSDPNVGICTRDEADTFFRPHGRPFTKEVFRRYLEACTIVRRGRIEETMSVNSMRTIVLCICGAARRASNPIPRDVVRDAFNFIEGTLLSRGAVHPKRKEKRTATSFDIAEFLSKLVHRDFTCQLWTTRDALLVLLFVNLQIDTGARGGEILRTAVRGEITEKHKTQLAEKELRWGNVEVYVFKGEHTDSENSNSIFARITFFHTKGRTRKQSGTKRIPLRSLPARLAWGDSLFWLMVLGIIDGAFRDVTSWSDIDKIRPDPMGTQLFVKPTMQDMPVFRTAMKNRSTTNPSQLISDEQMTTNQMGRSLTALSKFCKLEENFMPSLLRRAAAYQLSKAVSQEERCIIMGHNPKDNVYWNHYRNETSTVDFQGLRYGLEIKDVARMSSVFLGTGTAKPPTQVSDAGMARIYKDSALLQIYDEHTATRAQLLDAYGTMVNAERCDDISFKEYQRLRQAYHIRLATLKRATLRMETQQYWVMRHNGLVYDDENNPASAQPHDNDTTTIQPTEIIRIQENTEAAADTAIHSDDDIISDPRQLLGHLKETSTPSISEQDANEQSDTFTPPLPSSTLLLEEEEEGPEFDAVELPAAGSAPPSVPVTRQYHGQKTSQPFNLLDDAPRLLFGQDPVTHKTIANYFVTNFNRLHRADLFYPGEEPLPGTMDCRFCGLDLRTLPSGQATHASNCHRKVLVEQQLSSLREKDVTAATTCPLQKTRLSSSRGDSAIADETPCSANLEHGPALWRHIFKSHVGVREMPPTQSTDNGYATITQQLKDATYGCLAHDEPIYFTCMRDLRMHFVIAHNMHSVILRSSSNTARLADDITTFYCVFCQGWICRSQHLQLDHMQQHLDKDILNQVVEHGVFSTVDTLGQRTGNRGTRCFCPFCLYDGNLCGISRLFTSTTPRTLGIHIATHLARMRGVMPCPASRSTPEHLPMCSQVEPLNATQLTEHLCTAHNMSVVSNFLKADGETVKLIDSHANKYKGSKKTGSRGKRRREEEDKEEEVEEDEEIDVVEEEEDGEEEEAAQSEDARTMTLTKTATASVSLKTKRTRSAGVHHNGAAKPDGDLNARQPLSNMDTNRRRMPPHATKRRDHEHREL